MRPGSGTIMFTDDPESESREQVEENLKGWRFVLQGRGMNVSRRQDRKYL